MCMPVGWAFFFLREIVILLSHYRQKQVKIFCYHIPQVSVIVHLFELGVCYMKRILVVDDKEEVRMVYLLLFGDDSLEVIEAGNGREALDIVHSEPVDLVLSDCAMPEMTGPELMHALKDTHPELPFIFVSANVSEAHLEGLEPVAVLPKPFNLGELKVRVHDALEIQSV